jgi:predicted nucleotidyltransferase
MKEVDVFGLSNRDRQTIIRLLNKYSLLNNTVVFGSRARGDYHSGSDIDLAIIGGSMDIRRLRALKEDFAESSLPYNVDVVDVSHLSNESLKEQIFTFGKPVTLRNTK